MPSSPRHHRTPRSDDGFHRPRRPTLVKPRRRQRPRDATSRVAITRLPCSLVIRDLAIVLAATLIPLIFVNRLWEGSLRDPFTYFGDSHFYGMVARNIIENGWYQHTDRLGAPVGQQLYDFPLEGDNFWYLVMRFLALFTSDWVLVINLFYLLSFFLAAVSVFFSLRWLGVRRVSATVAAVLFAFAPYHFLRGVSHLTYSGYAVVPIGVVFAVRAARGEHPFSGIRDGTARALARSRRLARARSPPRLVQRVLCRLLDIDDRDRRARHRGGVPGLASPARRRRVGRAHRRRTRRQLVAVIAVRARTREEHRGGGSAGRRGRPLRLACDPAAHAHPRPPTRAPGQAVERPAANAVQFRAVDVPRTRRQHRARRDDRRVARTCGAVRGGADG